MIEQFIEQSASHSQSDKTIKVSSHLDFPINRQSGQVDKASQFPLISREQHRHQLPISVVRWSSKLNWWKVGAFPPSITHLTFGTHFNQTIGVGFHHHWQAEFVPSSVTDLTFGHQAINYWLWQVIPSSVIRLELYWLSQPIEVNAGNENDTNEYRMCDQLWCDLIFEFSKFSFDLSRCLITHDLWLSKIGRMVVTTTVYIVFERWWSCVNFDSSGTR